MGLPLLPTAPLTLAPQQGIPNSYPALLPVLFSSPHLNQQHPQKPILLRHLLREPLIRGNDVIAECFSRGETLRCLALLLRGDEVVDVHEGRLEGLVEVSFFFFVREGAGEAKEIWM